MFVRTLNTYVCGSTVRDHCTLETTPVCSVGEHCRVGPHNRSAAGRNRSPVHPQLAEDGSQMLRERSQSEKLPNNSIHLCDLQKSTSEIIATKISGFRGLGRRRGSDDEGVPGGSISRWWEHIPSSVRVTIYMAVCLCQSPRTAHQRK